MKRHEKQLRHGNTDALRGRQGGHTTSICWCDGVEARQHSRAVHTRVQRCIYYKNGTYLEKVLQQAPLPRSLSGFTMKKSKPTSCCANIARLKLSLFLRPLVFTASRPGFHRCHRLYATWGVWSPAFLEQTTYN